jgi:ribosomal-protein-alanine N-acetyltransferase
MVAMLPGRAPAVHVDPRFVLVCSVTVEGVGDGVVLETDRLVLRRLTLDDLDALSSLYTDPAVRRFFPEGTLTRAETLAELEWIIDVYYGRYGYGLWATVDKQTGDVIGRCGLLPFKVVAPTSPARLTLEDPDEHPIDGDRYEVEVAYTLARDRWGHGFATEAAAAIVEYGFEHLDVERLISLIDPRNDASASVARRCGMTIDGEVKLGDDVVPLHAITRATWTARSTA